MLAKRFWAFSGMPVFQSSFGHLIFQELDLCLFGVLKRQGQYVLPFDDNRTTTNFLLKIYRTLRQTMVEANILEAFQEAGLGFDTSSEPYRIRFSEKNCEELRDSKKYGCSTSPWRNYRQDDKMRNLDGLTD
jgi:hypothetical protein